MRQALLARFSSVACAAAIVLAQASANAGSPGSVQKAEALPQASATPPSVTRPKENPIPDTFVNLQLLPKDITKQELVGLMKQLSITFKVRCSYCHAVSDDLTQGSFDSDEKQTKQEARKFMKMLLAMGQRAGAVHDGPRSNPWQCSVSDRDLGPVSGLSPVP